jgi:hypothetical protein
MAGWAGPWNIPKPARWSVTLVDNSKRGEGTPGLRASLCPGALASDLARAPSRERATRERVAREIVIRECTTPVARTRHYISIVDSAFGHARASGLWTCERAEIERVAC